MLPGTIEPNPRATYRVAHADDALLVVEKPPGRVTLPGRGHETDSLLNGLFVDHAAALQRLGKERSFGVMHRLDRETSGLVMVAKSIEAYDALDTQLRAGGIAKFYYAVVKRAPNKPVGAIDRPLVEYQGEARTPLGQRAEKLKLVRVASSGKRSTTAYRVLSSSEGGALLECRAVTGRLHQVRAHLASIRCPVLGDRFYANAAVADAAPRLALHAHRIVLTHPVTGKPIDARSKLPKDIRQVCRRLGISLPSSGGGSGGGDGSGVDGEHGVGADPVGDQQAGV
ncbi:MAG: RluA family pseudouridine synthase [Planctomycetota bacterium]